MGVVPLLIFFNEASINTFLDLALDFFNLFLWSGIRTTPHSRLFKFWFQFQVHLDQFFTRKGRRQGAEHLLIGYQQFLQAGVKVKTLEFIKEILLSMEVALSRNCFSADQQFRLAQNHRPTQGDIASHTAENTLEVSQDQAAYRTHRPPQTRWKISRSV